MKRTYNVCMKLLKGLRECWSVGDEAHEVMTANHQRSARGYVKDVGNGQFKWIETDPGTRRE